MLQKIKVIIAYDGTNYCGWQKQKDFNTIEGELLKACEALRWESPIIVGASRTDAGVHALGQTATIEVDTRIPVDRIPRALNAHLPDDIIVQEAEIVDEDFNPRFDPIDKTYRYQIHNAKMPLPQYLRYAHYVRKPLDIEKMREGAAYIIGEHDFIAFSSAGGSSKTTVRTVYSCDVIQSSDLINIEITGNAFLYNMVRKIAATLIDVGLGELEPIDVQRILESKDRAKSSPKAPAKGLTLVKIRYQ